MKIYLPLLFFSSAFYGSVPLVMNYFSAQAHAKRYGLIGSLLNVLLLMVLVSFTSEWQTTVRIIFWDSLGIFIISMGMLSYAMPTVSPLHSAASKIMALNFAVVFFIILTFFFLSLTVQWHPHTEDFLLYRVDITLGFDPVAWLFVHLNRYFIFLCNVVYLSIPFAFLMVCASFYAQARQLPWHLIKQCVMAAVLAWLLFHLLPAVGPAYAVAPGDAPRNCMPSLHAAWIYLIWCFSRHLKCYRLITISFVLTLLGTLTSGEHYLIDIVLGLVFAIGIQAGANQQGRIAGFCAGVYIFWMWLIFGQVDFLLAHHGLSLLLWLGTLMVVFIFHCAVDIRHSSIERIFT